MTKSKTMTSKFAEQAEKYAESVSDCNPVRYSRAYEDYLAGAELGYRVGKDERACSVELTCEGGIFECQKEQLEQERDQLKQQLEFAQGRQEHWFKEAMEVRGEANQLHTRLEDAEKALKFYAAQSEPAAFAYLADTGDTARSYFKKHPQDSAKGDL